MPNLPSSFRARAGLVAVVWAATALLVAAGKQQCSVAAVLHRPCPGCGLTRAAMMLLHGHVSDSLAMHPMLLLVVGAWTMIAYATIASTLKEGVPWYFWRARFGKLAALTTVSVYVALVVLWALRGAGYFGGPVPV